MTSSEPLIFKTATEDWEFEHIHRLNYRTFVEEIPQHKASPTHRLVDKFHAENTYLICLSEQKLVGMLAVRGNRPFSLDQKLPDLDQLLPAGRTVCEIRLLSIEKKFRGARGGQVLAGILALLWQHGVEKGYDLAIISGTIRQMKLYQHLGFVPFGPVVGTGEAQFQPMFVTLETFEVTAREFLRSAPAKSFRAGAVNFLPGPVSVRREVRRAFEQAPESHRSNSFKTDFAAAQKALCELVQAPQVQILMGSGTLANDAVAGQLSLENTPGIVLSNGEFGDRLIDHARRAQLDFRALEFPWGRALDLEAVRKVLDAAPRAGWLWVTHCETSSGVLNDLAALKALCAARNVKLCVDCISTVGTVPVDLTGVFLATATSGKGLRSYPGLGLVFHHHDLSPAGGRLPRCLDLGYYAAQGGIPFTLSSNLVHALHAAIRHVDWPRRFAAIAEWSGYVHERLRGMNVEVIGADSVTSPAVMTLALPSEMNAVKFGAAMQEAGFLLSYNSEYLREKNWLQFCFMGECTREKVVSLMNAFQRAGLQRNAAIAAQVGS
jgi:aspartate aminotransferase-like enzyme